MSVLEKRHSGYQGQHNGSRANILKFREIRRQYQEDGRTKARENDPLHVAGCMLYWGEGSKQKNHLELANSDADMLTFFLKFLQLSLLVPKNEIVVRVNCYDNNGLSVDEIENYWLGVLDLPRECLAKTLVNRQPISSQQRGRKLLYGMCHIRVYSSRLVQHIYGAIQEYTGIDKPEWLF
ncbi:MAG: hypothetical protein H7175_05845 [Burkholderiales bacterium]|nr:hypothetical protein [Anaerolineae bacterium]